MGNWDAEEKIYSQVVMFCIVVILILGGSLLAYNSGKADGLVEGRVQGMKLLSSGQATCVKVIKEYACEYKDMPEVSE